LNNKYERNWGAIRVKDCYDSRFSEYYKSKMYRGFKEIRGHTSKLTLTSCFTFSNGEREIFGSGCFPDEALVKIFDRIDKYHSTNKKVTPNIHVLP
jgi:hypothetical protein